MTPLLTFVFSDTLPAEIGKEGSLIVGTRIFTCTIKNSSLHNFVIALFLSSTRDTKLVCLGVLFIYLFIAISGKMETLAGGISPVITMQRTPAQPISTTTLPTTNISTQQNTAKIITNSSKYSTALFFKDCFGIAVDTRDGMCYITVWLSAKNCGNFF